MCVCLCVSVCIDLSQNRYQLNYKDGVIVSGSLEALIEEFYPTATHYPDVRNNQSYTICILSLFLYSIVTSLHFFFASVYSCNHTTSLLKCAEYVNVLYISSAIDVVHYTANTSVSSQGIRGKCSRLWL